MDSTSHERSLDGAAQARRERARALAAQAWEAWSAGDVDRARGLTRRARAVAEADAELLAWLDEAETAVREAEHLPPGGRPRRPFVRAKRPPDRRAHAAAALAQDPTRGPSGRVVPVAEAPPPLRKDQAAIIDAFFDHLAALGPDSAPSARWVHIVLPPRTGKTVIAAHIARRSGLHAAFVVPTLVLVDQTHRELARHAPGLPLGDWSSERKGLVPDGLNVTTYAMLHARERAWPEALASARLVLVDEAHHALTTDRVRALTEGFPADAIRVALTATPDFDERRRLETVFPTRIARMELRDALAAGLLAPTQVHVGQVDADGSTVEVVAGEYRVDQLERLMSSGPFLHAALTWRYQAEHRDISAMVCCVTRQQAADLVAYFERHRPAGSSPPALVIAETPSAERERVLAGFEAGTLDTLVQVGVLVEGWSSLRCKLLIDLAPGRSRVRATQKYFRALTRNGDAVARLVVIIPRRLPRPPVLPMDLLLDPGETYDCGRTIGDRARSPRRAVEGAGLSPIRGVDLLQRVVVCARLGLPRLRRDCLHELRAVLKSCNAIDPREPPGRMAFEAAYLQHPLFSGTGLMLLRWLGVERSPGAYDAWLAKLYPEQIADRLLGAVDALAPPDADLPIDLLYPPNIDVEARLLQAETEARVARIVATLPARQRRVLRAWCGFDAEPLGYGPLGESEQLSRERVRQIVIGAVANCRDALVAEERLVRHGRDADWLQRLRVGRSPELEFAADQRRLGHRESAVSTLQALIRAEPAHVEAHAMLAEVLFELGQSRGIAQHVAMVATSPHGPHRFALGLALRRRERFGHALALFDGHTPAWWAAEARTRLGREALALERLEAGPYLDVETRMFRVLLRQRLSLPVGRATLFALAPRAGYDLARELIERGGSEFVLLTRDLWSSAALDRLEAWTLDPKVGSWRADVEAASAEGTGSAEVWARATQVVQAMGERG